MKESSEILDEYVSPPSYSSSGTSYEDPLMKKLHMRIHKDIQQINGVYDEQIKDAQQRKKIYIEEIEKNFDITFSEINKKRAVEIKEYNDRAEKYIDNLILNMSTTNEKEFSVDYVLKLLRIR